MKHRYELIDNNFLSTLADVLEAGIKDDRIANGWKNLDWCVEREQHYLGRVMSHIVKAENAPREDKAWHCASIAANAMIIAWHSEHPIRHRHFPEGLEWLEDWKQWVSSESGARESPTMHVSPTKEEAEQRAKKHLWSLGMPVCVADNDVIHHIFGNFDGIDKPHIDPLKASWRPRVSTTPLHKFSPSDKELKAWRDAMGFDHVAASPWVNLARGERTVTTHINFEGIDPVDHEPESYKK